MVPGLSVQARRHAGTPARSGRAKRFQRKPEKEPRKTLKARMAPGLAAFV